MDDIAEFNQALQVEIIRDAEESGISASDSFFEHMAARLEAVGEIETTERAAYEGSSSSKTIRIDGSGGDPRDSDGVLSVMICDFHECDVLASINASDVKRKFEHLLNFLTLARDEDFRAKLKHGSPSAGLADTIAATWGSKPKPAEISDADPTPVLQGVDLHFWALYKIWWNRQWADFGADPGRLKAPKPSNGQLTIASPLKVGYAFLFQVFQHSMCCELLRPEIPV